MARIRPQVNPNNPIPNNPFYSPESNYINGVSGPFIVGSGLSINNITGTISAAGGGGGAVSQVLGAAGISVSPATGTGNITVSNTGVLTLSAGSGIAVSASTGNITISSTSGATVGNVIGTAPISVVDGTTTPNISVATATTTNSGVTTLIDNLVTNDNTKALTAAQGKILQDQITSLVVSGTIELAGTVNANTGLVLSVTSVGASDGYAVGSALPPASATTNNTYVIVTTPGTLTPPGGSPTVATQGDWFLVSEVTPGVYQWTFLNVGFDASPATDTVAGIVELATNGETQTGTDATRAVTPAAAAATYVPLSTLAAKGTLIAGQAASSPVALPVGTIGQVLQVDPTTTSGLKWVTPPVGCSGTVTQVSTGAGLTGGPITTLGTLDLVNQGISAGTYTNPSVTVNCYGVITAVSSGTSGIPCACITAKGDLIAGTAANTPSALGVGTNGQILAACSTATTGLCWVPGIVAATPVALGTLIGCTTGGNAALGCESQASGTGSNNVSAGRATLCSNTTGFQNTALGHISMCSSTTGFQNTSVGSTAMCAFVSGCSNEAFGAVALSSFTSGNFNVALGGYSLFSLISGCYSTAVGHRALTAATGSTNTALGAFSGKNITTGNLNVVIGANVDVPNGTGSCQLAIGWDSTQYWLTGCGNRNIRPGAGILDDTGAVGLTSQYLWSTGTGIRWSNASPSDARDKVIHGAIEAALPLINGIEAVSYNWKPRTTGVEEEELVYGFVAQQLQEVDPVLVDSSDPEQLRIYDRKITPLLVRAIQELSEKVNTLQEKLDKLEANG